MFRPLSRSPPLFPPPLSFSPKPTLAPPPSGPKSSAISFSNSPPPPKTKPLTKPQFWRQSPKSSPTQDCLPRMFLGIVPRKTSVLCSRSTAPSWTLSLPCMTKTRNRGLAFVTMGSPKEARTALDNLESSEMEGCVIKMAYARPKKTDSPPSSQPKPITFNLYLENLPYEARSKDLKVLFKSEDYNVVTAEIVFQNNPRRSAGYGFVGFKTKAEAEAALSASHGKLLMGR